MLDLLECSRFFLWFLFLCLRERGESIRIITIRDQTFGNAPSLNPKSLVASKLWFTSSSFFLTLLIIFNICIYSL